MQTRGQILTSVQLIISPSQPAVQNCSFFLARCYYSGVLQRSPAYINDLDANILSGLKSY